MDDPIDNATPGTIDFSDFVTLVVSVIIILGSLALDAAGVWALPRELKVSMIAGAAAIVLGEKAVKTFYK